MIQALMVSNLLLWGVVAVLAFVVLALMRQVGVLHERVAPAGALVGREGPAIGEPAPAIEVEDWSGRKHRLGRSEAESQRTLLVFVSPNCPICKVLIPVVASLRRAERPSLRVVWASDGSRKEHESFVREHRLDRETYVLSTPLGLAYQVGKLPYAVLIDAQGTVRAKGLVNSREHLESLFEASERGVASVQEFRARQAGKGEAQRVA